MTNSVAVDEQLCTATCAVVLTAKYIVSINNINILKPKMILLNKL